MHIILQGTMFCTQINFILLAAAYNERGWLVEGLVTMTVHGVPYSLVSRPWLNLC